MAKLLNEEFPINIRMHRETFSEFRASEEGSYEDIQTGANDEYSDHTKHFYYWSDKLPSSPTILVIQDIDQLFETYHRLCSGTFQIDQEFGKSYFKHACRIADKLKPIVDKVIEDNRATDQHREIYLLTTYPSGY